jgi:hypothetical protein
LPPWEADRLLDWCQLTYGPRRSVRELRKQAQRLKERFSSLKSLSDPGEEEDEPPLPFAAPPLPLPSDDEKQMRLYELELTAAARALDEAEHRYLHVFGATDDRGFIEPLS